MNFFSKWLRTKDGQADSEILSKEAFYHTLERERARTDRYHHGFSLIVFKQRHSTNAKTNLSVFAAKLAQLHRKTDIVGWMGTDSIGVILSIISPVQVRTAAERLSAMAADPDIIYQIATYPSNDFPSTDKLDDSPGEKPPSP